MNISDLQKRVLAKRVLPTEFIFTVKTDNAGTSGTNQFTIPTSTVGNTQAFLYNIETSDGQTITGLTGNHTITFPSAGTYQIKINGSFPYMFFNNGGDRLKMIDISNFGIYALGATSQLRAFRGCNNMTITANDSGNFGSVTNFALAWQNCTSLTSFPLIDTSSGTNFSEFGIGAWRGCSNLISFPLLDFTSATNLGSTWQECSKLANFPANAFDTTIGNSYGAAFSSTALNETSIDNILVSINTANTSGGTFNQSGGSAPSVATGRPAIDALRARGWTVTVTGGY
jgi:hypothetical protein